MRQEEFYVLEEKMKFIYEPIYLIDSLMIEGRYR